jgi:hypothetical protein
MRALASLCIIGDSESNRHGLPIKKLLSTEPWRRSQPKVAVYFVLHAGWNIYSDSRDTGIWKNRSLEGTSCIVQVDGMVEYMKGFSAAYLTEALQTYRLMNSVLDKWSD